MARLKGCAMYGCTVSNKFRQPKILEVSNFGPEFRKNMVSNPFNPYLSEKPFSWRFQKGITYPYLQNTIFPEIGQH